MEAQLIAQMFTIVTQDDESEAIVLSYMVSMILPDSDFAKIFEQEAKETLLSFRAKSSVSVEFDFDGASVQE